MADDIEEKLRKLAPINEPTAHRGWRLYLSGEGQERSEVSELIDILLFQQAGKDFREAIFLDPPPPTACSGEYELGSVIYPPGHSFCRFGLREDEWIKHVLIVGMTGVGKTNLVFHMLQQLREHGKPFLVFDWKKNYRDLRQLPDMRETAVRTVARHESPFYFNPLIPPPGTTPGEWLMKLVDVIKHAYFVGDGVEYLLREAIDTAYERCGFYSETLGEAPTFYLVRNLLVARRVHGRMLLWKASALRVLESLCFRHGLGPVVNSPTPIDPDEFLQAPVVLELDALSDVDKVFLSEALILWLYEFRKSEPGRETFKHALVIEEGHHILSRFKERHEGAETIIETCLRQIREFGESVIVVDQEPSKLSDSIKANTYSKVTFNLGNGADIEDMARCLSLTPEERGYIDHLRVGAAIVTVGQRLNVPLHVRFPHVNIRKGNTRLAKDPGI